MFAWVDARAKRTNKRADCRRPAAAAPATARTSASTDGGGLNNSERLASRPTVTSLTRSLAEAPRRRGHAEQSKASVRSVHPSSSARRWIARRGGASRMAVVATAFSSSSSRLGRSMRRGSSSVTLWTAPRVCLCSRATTVDLRGVLGSLLCGDLNLVCLEAWTCLAHSRVAFQRNVVNLRKSRFSEPRGRPRANLEPRQTELASSTNECV